MLLLNRYTDRSSIAKIEKFTFQYASIKPCKEKGITAGVYSFTFQYASIKPHIPQNKPLKVPDLHFNMLLLNPLRIEHTNNLTEIYISICFY